MQQEWLKKLPKLEILADHVEDFFRKENFTVETIPPQVDKARITILALPTEKSATGQSIRVEISETLNGTAVDFVPTSRAEDSIRLGIVAQFLIGGAIMARSLDVVEKLRALETEFWNNLQEFIASQ